MNLSALSYVAKSGSYDDLVNKPQIPTAVAVKGNAETAYRTGNVNITPANIGLGNVNNTADSAKSVNYANSAGTVEWNNITNKPSSFAPSSHTHDERYYTETEINNIIWNEIQVKEFTMDNQSFTANNPVTKEFGISISGWYVAGIVAFSAENATSEGKNSSQCGIYNVWFSQEKVWMSIRAWADAKVKLKVKVLYWKDPR